MGATEGWIRWIWLLIGGAGRFRMRDVVRGKPVGEPRTHPQANHTTQPAISPIAHSTSLIQYVQISTDANGDGELSDDEFARAMEIAAALVSEVLRARVACSDSCVAGVL